MIIILITLAAIFVAALALHLYKQMNQRLERRMEENGYNAAVTLWNYARKVKAQIDYATRAGAGVLDFSKIAVPHSKGYKISFELIGAYFRVYAVPYEYYKTGKLSFFTDNTLTVRASDHAGQQATAQDLEYKGD